MLLREHRGLFSQTLHREIFWDNDEILIGGVVEADWLIGLTLIDLWVLLGCLTSCLGGSRSSVFWEH